LKRGWVIPAGGEGSAQPGRGDALVLGKVGEFGDVADANPAGSNSNAGEREQSTSSTDSASLAEEVRQIFEWQETQERLAREIVEQANLQRLQQSREEINVQVQKQMFAYLLQMAEIQPQPAQIERIQKSNTLPNESVSSRNENVQFSSALEASHWLLVQNESSTGTDVLDDFTKKVEKEHKSAEDAERKEESVKRFEIPPDELEDCYDNSEMDYEYSI
jgi:hypothetical protein